MAEKNRQQHPLETILGVKRNDPDPRPVEGATNRVDLQGKDPEKHYVYVSNAADPTLNPRSYLNRGYRFTQYDPDGAQPVYGYHADLKQGDKIEEFGCVLMECDLAHKAELEAKGQEWANKVEDSIRKRDIIDDTEPLSEVERAKLRGIVTGRRYAGDDRHVWGF